MIERVRELSDILNESYNEKTVTASLRDFFSKNFNAQLEDIILKEEYCSNNKLYPLFKHNKAIGFLEFKTSNQKLEEFLDITIYMVSLKIQNIVLNDKMQRTIDFQNSMKNIAKIIETQYELRYIIPLMGEMIDKFFQDHLIYIFIKHNSEFKLMWPSACNDTKVLDIIAAQPLKRVNRDDLGIFPMISEDKLLGYIVTKTLDNKLSVKEIEYLDELSQQAAITINRANTYAGILKDATLDALTGFYNRKQLEERIKQEVSNARRQKAPLCAIMTDIDFFKKVNDTYGHSVGDLVLKTVSKIMRSQLREYDIAGRYGGEEFAILLPFTQIDAAQMVAERLRKTVEINKINISGVNPDAKDKNISVTISMGIYELKDDDKDDDLLKNADKGLYTAKETGRNKVVVYEI